MRSLVLVTTLAAVLGSAATVAAQTPRPHRLTVAGGAVWSGGYPIGDSTAAIRQNAPGTTPPPLPLFRAESSFATAVGLEGRVGFAITPSIAVEGSIAWSEPHIDVDIVDDVENGNTSLDGETAAQYIVEASVVWTLPFVGQTARLRPYAIGGGGYLRQLHEERTLAETGQIYHVGGGVQYLLRGANGDRRPIGVRGDVRAYIRKDGIEFDDKVRTYPAVSALMFFGF